MGTIPKQMGNVKSLIVLSAYGNNLLGSVPSEVCALMTINLIYVDVDCVVNCTCCFRFCS
jgi:hypothetical protein